MKWISVKDRLPDIVADVLVRLDNDECVVAWCVDTAGDEDTYWDSCDCGLMNNNVTHWMPLPELIKD